MDPKTLSSRYQPDLDEEFRLAVGNSSLPLYQMMRYHLGWVDAEGKSIITSKGKLIRPSLCLLSCEAVGGDWKKALPAAVALELLHNFTLIHDDIEDGDHERRGIPTVWHVWGIPQGINTGDAMHVLARLALFRLEEQGVSHSRVLRSARLLDETCLRLCEGQCLDISFEERLDVGVDDYLNMVEGKTAALFSCSFGIGALLGTDDGTKIERLSEFGRNLGLAFQVKDDVLGIWGEDSKTGKSTSSDILKKKKSLPVVYAFENAGREQIKELTAIYNQDEIDAIDIVSVQNILEESGARKYSEGIARKYSDKAMSCLAKADIATSYKEDFTSMAGFMVDREY